MLLYALYLYLPYADLWDKSPLQPASSILSYRPDKAMMPALTRKLDMMAARKGTTSDSESVLGVLKLMADLRLSTGHSCSV